MRFFATLACVIVAADCAEKAAGFEAQNLFSEAALWVWWVAAFSWVCNGIYFALNGAE